MFVGSSNLVLNSTCSWNTKAPPVSALCGSVVCPDGFRRKLAAQVATGQKEETNGPSKCGMDHT